MCEPFTIEYNNHYRIIHVFLQFSIIRLFLFLIFHTTTLRRCSFFTAFVCICPQLHHWPGDINPTLNTVNIKCSQQIIFNFIKHKYLYQIVACFLTNVLVKPVAPFTWKTIEVLNNKFYTWPANLFWMFSRLCGWLRFHIIGCILYILLFILIWRIFFYCIYHPNIFFSPWLI